MITLRDASTHLHEYLHIILTRHGERWQVEGINEYLAIFTYPNTYMKELLTETIKDHGFDAAFFLGEGLEEYEAIIKERYARYTGGDETAPLDMRSIYDATSFALYNDETGIFRECDLAMTTPLNQTPFFNQKHKDCAGNDLSYTEAASFIAYLVDTYSAEVTLNLLRNSCTDLADVFGKDYETLYNDWITFLHR